MAATLGDRSRCDIDERQSRSRAAATARAWMRSAGCVPADSAGALVTDRHSAAASWLRAELRVHTNSARR